MQPRRGATLAAVLVCAVSAGTMESSSGSEMATPRPCSMVRRDKCFLVTIVIDVSLLIMARTAAEQRRGLNRRTGGIRGVLNLHAELRALHNARNQIRKAVVI